MKWIFFCDGVLRFGWGILLFLSITIGLQIAHSSLFLRHMGAGAMETPSGLLQVELVRAAIVVSATLLMALIEKRSWQEYGLKTSGAVKLFLQGSIWGLVTIFLLLGILVAAGFVRVRAESGSATAAIWSGFLWMLAYFCVVINEELTFRGYLQRTLARSIGFWKAALALSLWFALGHLGNQGEGWLGLVQTHNVGLTFLIVQSLTSSFVHIRYFRFPQLMSLALQWDPYLGLVVKLV